MREILFRGKRVDSGEWVEGYVCENIYGQICIQDLSENRGCGCVVVDPETIGQYTSIKDKNDKQIFDGDIIKVPDDYDEFGMNAGEVYQVYFCYGGFRLKPKYSIARGYWLEDDNTFELLGNICDNRLEDF